MRAHVHTSRPWLKYNHIYQYVNIEICIHMMYLKGFKNKFIVYHFSANKTYQRIRWQSPDWWKFIFVPNFGEKAVQPSSLVIKCLTFVCLACRSISTSGNGQNTQAADLLIPYKSCSFRLWVFMNCQRNTLYCCIDFSMSQDVSTPSDHLQVFSHYVHNIINLQRMYISTQFTVAFDQIDTIW
jgi:hypothetical protein